MSRHSIGFLQFPLFLVCITPATLVGIYTQFNSILSKELGEVKRKSAALQMQQFVGEEKNDLLDYLRSLQPEKVTIFKS
jgi:hypothetical protein